MAFLPISETLKQESWHGPAKGVYLSLRVEKVLEKLLPQLGSGAEMYSLREGRLTLLTPSPASSQELYLCREVLKRKINEALGGKAVEEIKLKVK